MMLLFVHFNRRNLSDRANFMFYRAEIIFCFESTRQYQYLLVMGSLYPLVTHDPRGTDLGNKKCLFKKGKPNAL